MKHNLIKRKREKQEGKGKRESKRHSPPTYKPPIQVPEALLVYVSGWQKRIFIAWS